MSQMTISGAKLRPYAALRRAVMAALVTGQREIERAKVLTYWKTGRLIQQHLLLHAERADYGSEVIRRLAQDLNVHHSVLYRCLRFARAFPIVAARQQLSWAHYRVLIPIADEARRQELEQAAIRQGWTSHELEERARQLRLQFAPPAPASASGRAGGVGRPLSAKHGTVGVHRLIAHREGLAVDLGFTCYLELAEDQVAARKAGELVRLEASGKILPVAGASAADLYTYPAQVVRVVDGDTLWMEVYLTPRLWLKEKLRLRGLDCPELATSEGKAAKRFVETWVARAVAVTITTTKPDKYDRYLSDVFLETEAGEDVFLNNLLLENGHAVRKDSYTPGDWEPG